MASGKSRVVVEELVPLSNSVLWALQRRFYLGRGPDAWAKSLVPSWITSNPLIAAFYVDMVLTWALEGLHHEPARVRPADPIIIVEMGSGSGTFAHRFLTRLTELEPLWRSEGLSFRYVLTDLAPANVSFWKAHPALRPFMESGLLEVARWDPLEDGAAIYPEGGSPITAGATTNPIVAIGNYFFDSIPTDLLRVNDGTAEQARLTTTAPKPIGRRPKPSVIETLERTWTWLPWDGTGDPLLDEIVEYYRDTIDKATFTFPVGGFEVLTILEELSAGRLLLLTADKGANNTSRFGGDEHMTVIRHGDGFSFDVNLDAMGRWVDARGGTVLHNTTWSSLAISAMILGERGSHLPATRLAWHRTMDARDPSEFYAHLRTFQKHEGKLDPKQLTTLLRESAWDPYIVQTLQPKTVGSVKTLDRAMKRRLTHGLRRAWRNHFHIGTRSDVPFQFGSLAFELEEWSDARTYFEASVELHKPTAAALHNIGLAHAKEGKWHDALPWFERAIAHEPAFEASTKFQKLALRVVKAEALAASALESVEE